MNHGVPPQHRPKAPPPQVTVKLFPEYYMDRTDHYAQACNALQRAQLQSAGAVFLLNAGEAEHAVSDFSDRLLLDVEFPEGYVQVDVKPERGRLGTGQVDMVHHAIAAKMENLNLAVNCPPTAADRKALFVRPPRILDGNDFVNVTSVFEKDLRAHVEWCRANPLDLGHLIIFDFAVTEVPGGTHARDIFAKVAQSYQDDPAVVITILPQPPKLHTDDAVGWARLLSDRLCLHEGSGLNRKILNHKLETEITKRLRAGPSLLELKETEPPLAEIVDKILRSARINHVP